MAVSSSLSSSVVLLFLTTVSLLGLTSAIGVNYGTLGQLPAPAEVANFIKSKTNIDAVKIFDANPEILRAFANSGISVIVSIPNGDIPALADGRQARRWVAANIEPFYQQTKIKYISVGSGILLTFDNNLISNLLPAMQNLHVALREAGINDTKVTTAHALNIVAYELNGAPSVARFRPGWDKGVLAPILDFHRRTKSPFMVNPFPYFGFDPRNYNFAIFRPSPPVHDPFTGHVYTNMYDTLLDSTYSAMKALGYGDVDIVVGETGWPSACDAPWCSPANAQWFNQNVMMRADGTQGTPLMPGRKIETYVFAMFNENQKPGPTAERNWGLFQPDFTPVYDVGLLKNGGNGNSSGAPISVTPSAGAKSWCVAKAEATDAQLQSSLDYACGPGGVDCRPIQAGGVCFEPNNVRSHATYAMNAYYQSHGRGDGTCFFSGTGIVTAMIPPEEYSSRCLEFVP